MEEEKTKKFRSVVYLSVYRLNRCYGGPEEGGWYYDNYEFEAATPFMGEVTLCEHIADLSDPNDRPPEGRQVWESKDSLSWWKVKSIAVEDHEMFLDEAVRLAQLYDVDLTEPVKFDRGWHGRHIAIVLEYFRGERERKARPRYC